MPTTTVLGHECHDQFQTRFENEIVYTVTSGDSLWLISSCFTGSGKNWRKFKDKNKQICNPNLVYPGNELLLPLDWIQDSIQRNIDVTCSQGVVIDELEHVTSEEGVDSAADEEPDDRNNSELDRKLAAISRGESDPSLDPTNEFLEWISRYGRNSAADKLLEWFPTSEKVSTFFEFLELYNNEIRYLDSPTNNEQETSDKIRKKVITVLFSNGVGNLPSDAYNSAVALQKAMSQEKGGVDALRFAYTYNITKGIAEDVLEAFFQFDDRDKVSGWHHMFGATDTSAQAHGNFLAKLSDRILNSPASTLFSNYEKQITDYRLAIREESCGVVVVAHSQGNLFASWIYNQLPQSDTDHVRVISVASPASKTAHAQSEFFTNGPGSMSEEASRYIEGDKVIGVIELLANKTQRPRPLPRNVVHVSDSDDFLAHGFVEAYIGMGDPARDSIINAVKREVETLREAAEKSCTHDASGPLKKPDLNPVTVFSFASLIGLVVLYLARRRNNKRLKAT